METFNKFGVGLAGADVVILMPPRRLSPADAVMFAAWLVTMAKIADAKAPGILECVAAVEES
jgi:hypothetical protein